MQINGNKWLAGAAFALLMGIFYFYDSYMMIGGFGVGYQYIGCIMVITLGLGRFLVTPDLPYLVHSRKTAGILALPYLAVMLCTAVIWIFDFTPVRQMISGFFEPMYMVLCIVCAAVLVNIFRDRTAECSFWALSAALGIMVLQRLQRFGAAEFIRRLFLYVRSGGTAYGSVSVEAASYAYVYAFFALYFLFHQRKEPLWKQLVRWGVMAFALLEAFKRSALLALAVGAVFALLYCRIPGPYKKLFLNAAVVLFVLLAFFIIPVIRYGLFTRIVDELQINTSARTRIYAYYEQYYEFTPLYTGRGLGWIQRLVASTERFNVGLKAVNVHCDYVRYYIELGFAGYLIWMLLVFPMVVKRTVKGTSPQDDAAILGVCAAMAVLRMTENISQLYSATLGISILIIQCCMNRWDADRTAAGPDG